MRKGLFTQSSTAQKTTIGCNTHFETFKSLTMSSSTTYGDRTLPYHDGMVPDDTVHKGTSKNHKTDEKSPILRSMFLHQYLILKHYPSTPNAHQIASWEDLKISILTEKHTSLFCQFCFEFGSDPKNSISC